MNMTDTQQERDQVLDMIQRNLSQVSHMMNQMLDYSRLESGEEKFQNELFDAGTLLAGLCEGFAQFAREKDLYIRFEGPASMVLEGDLVKVRRIVQNLILNALKYTEKGGVDISWHAIEPTPDNTPSWQITVSDTGPGLPQRLHSRLTSIAPELTNSDLENDSSDGNLNSDAHGEGIGLFIVKRLCELLKAALHVSSTPGEGTTFQIVFPMSYSTGEGSRD